MIKVTLTVETDEQYTSVSRWDEKDKKDVARLFAEAIWRVADTFQTDVLEDMSRAVSAALDARDRAARRVRVAVDPEEKPSA